MTVSTTTARVSYSGDGTTTAFPVPFPFVVNTDLRAYLVAADGTATLQTYSTHYSVTGALSASGGTLTMVTAPAVGTTLLILRAPPLTQPTDYRTNDPFPAETHETALDRHVGQIQYLQEQLDRCLRFGVTADARNEMSPVSAWLGKLVGINSVTGQPEPVASSATEGGETLLRQHRLSATPPDTPCVDGQTVVILPWSYTVGTGALSVYRNGSLQESGIDYVETATDRITMVTALASAETLSIHAGQPRDSGVVSQSEIGAALWPVQVLETDAGVTPAAFHVEPLRRARYPSDAAFTLVQAELREFLKLAWLDLYSEGNTSQALLAHERGLVNLPLLENTVGQFNVVPRGSVTGANTARAVIRVWNKDIAADPDGARRGGGMEQHNGSDDDAVDRFRLVTRSEGASPQKHPDTYCQLGGVNILYFGTKLDGGTGQGTVEFFPTGMTFKSGLTAWAAATAVAAGAERRVSKSDFRYLECTTPGTTGATEPTPGRVGTTVVDGGVTWTVRSRLVGTAALCLDQSGNNGYGCNDPEFGHDFEGSVRLRHSIVEKTVSVTHAASMQINCDLGNTFITTATNAALAGNFAIPANPRPGQRVLIGVANASGAAMANITFDAAFKLAGGAAFTEPATGFTRYIEFLCISSTVFHETWRSGADVATS